MTISFDRVGIYTQALNAAFVNSYEAIAEQAPIDVAITDVNSKGRVENYPWMYPPPLMHRWEGFRQFAKLGATNYRVPNLTYTAEMEVLFEDLEDDQIDGFKRQAAALAKGAKEWRRIQCQQTLAAGQTTPCFDGTNFFANSHTIGTGDNLLAGTAAGSDGNTHAMAVLMTGDRMVKPLLWQNREAPDFQTDMGSIESKKHRVVKWWTDLRGAAAFGFWWDACLVKFANTPTVAEIQTTLGNVEAAFRGFTYPKNLPSDVNQYPHNNHEFTNETTTIVCSSGISHIVRQALTLSLVSATENPYRNWAKLVTSGYMNGVV